MTDLELTRLDRLTTTVTAFPNWTAFRDRLDSGYVPTIKGRNADERCLQDAVLAHGYRYFDGSR